MKLYYYKDLHGNFGDDLNPWLWSRILPGFMDDDDSKLFVGIGTLLNNNIPRKPSKIVFGAGVGYGSSLPYVDAKWSFYCVRGPLTAATLGLPVDCAITDAAALVSTVFDVDRSRRSGVAFIPHHVSAAYLDWEKVCEEVGLRYIDPRNDVNTVLGQIATSTAIITEALHGAILADAFRVPWMPVVLYEHILHLKWEDWTRSLSLEYQPKHLQGVWNPDYGYPFIDRFKNRIKRSLKSLSIAPHSWTPPPQKSRRAEIERFTEAFQGLVQNPSLQLSSDSNFHRAVFRLLEKLEHLRKDHCINV